MHAMPPRIVIASTVEELPSSHVGRFAKLLFDRLHQEVLARPKLSPRERNWFEGEAKSFDHHFKEILRNKDRRQRDFALRAVASALCLSFYHAGGTQILKEFRHQQIAPATAGRR